MSIGAGAGSLERVFGLEAVAPSPTCIEKDRDEERRRKRDIALEISSRSKPLKTLFSLFSRHIPSLEPVPLRKVRLENITAKVHSLIENVCNLVHLIHQRALPLAELLEEMERLGAFRSFHTHGPLSPLELSLEDREALDGWKHQAEDLAYFLERADYLVQDRLSHVVVRLCLTFSGNEKGGVYGKLGSTLQAVKQFRSNYEIDRAFIQQTLERFKELLTLFDHERKITPCAENGKISARPLKTAAEKRLQSVLAGTHISNITERCRLLNQKAYRLLENLAQEHIADTRVSKAELEGFLARFTRQLSDLKRSLTILHGEEMDKMWSSLSVKEVVGEYLRDSLETLDAMETLHPLLERNVKKVSEQGSVQSKPFFSQR